MFRRFLPSPRGQLLLLRGDETVSCTVLRVNIGRRLINAGLEIGRVVGAGTVRCLVDLIRGLEERRKPAEKSVRV